MNVKRSDTSPDFRAVGIFRVEFDGGRFGMFFVPLNENEQSFTRELPAKPREVLFAPDHALLARIKRE